MTDHTPERSAITCANNGEALAISAGAFSATISVAGIAHCWDALSHHPERRAKLSLRELAERLLAFGERLTELRAAGGSLDVLAEAESFTRRHVELTRAWWHADSRCASAFIVGPAKFPVASNRKRQDSADRRNQEVRDHVARARKAVERRAFPHGLPGGAIRGSNPDAPELLQREIAKLEQRQEMMRSANKAIRSVKSDDPEAIAQAVVDATGMSHATAYQVIKPSCFGTRGFEPFQLSNNSANLRRLRGRLAEIEAKRDQGDIARTHNTTAGAVEVVENVEADRVQLLFPGKPDDATRSVLKSNGFRWSPRCGAWQRHLNNAGRAAAGRVIGEIQTDRQGG
jgi:hypothetical protein